MSSLLLGAGAACAASSLYNVGLALQALDAREAPAGEALRLSLLRRLVRRPRWLAGTALNLLGWPLQAVALLLAPLVVVQPALAFGLVLLLAIGRAGLLEPVARREVAAVFGASPASSCWRRGPRAPPTTTRARASSRACWPSSASAPSPRRRSPGAGVRPAV